jgi:hypothetical protein
MPFANQPSLTLTGEYRALERFLPAQNWGQCYDHNFWQKNWRFSLKNNVTIQFLQSLADFLIKTESFVAKIKS